MYAVKIIIHIHIQCIESLVVLNYISQYQQWYTLQNNLIFEFWLVVWFHFFMIPKVIHRHRCTFKELPMMCVFHLTLTLASLHKKSWSLHWLMVSQPSDWVIMIISQSPSQDKTTIRHLYYMQTIFVTQLRNQKCPNQVKT